MDSRVPGGRWPPGPDLLNRDEGDPMLLRFKRNTAYEGTDYGPDYPEEVAEVDEPWATTFIAQGRAVPADSKPKPVKGVSDYPGKGDVQVQDPAIATQDPRPAWHERPLPDDFPGRGPLASAGVGTFDELLELLDSGELEDVHGIGSATARKIRSALENLRP